MSPLTIGVIVFACVFSGGMLGMFLRSALPEHHLSEESKDTIKVGIGLIATMAALVLGLLVATAKASFDTKSSELTEMSANTVLLDRVLAHYGPETKTARELLRGAVTLLFERVWPPPKASQTARLEPAMGRGEDFYDAIQALSPKDEAQSGLKNEALNIAIDLGKLRWLLFEQSSSSISTVFLIVVVFWLTIIFMSFGLFAPYNLTVVITLLVCAMSVAGAIFLILELDQPFGGLIQISSAPIQSALAHLGK